MKLLYYQSNTFESNRTLLKKESSFLDSLIQNLEKSKKSKTNQDKILESVHEWLKLANENLIRVTSFNNIVIPICRWMKHLQLKNKIGTMI